MRSFLLLGLVAIAAVVVWLVAARSLSLLADRLSTARITTEPVSRFRFDGGVIEVAGVRLDTFTPATMPSGLTVTIGPAGRAVLSYQGAAFPCGPGESIPVPSGLPNIPFSPDPGDTVTFTAEQSRLSWPTPFAMNFMTGSTPSWKRHLYCRVIWTKRSRARLEMLWRFEQGYFQPDGWRPQRIEFGSAGLVRVAITDAPDLQNAAADYLARTKNWERAAYRLENRGPSADGSGELIVAIHRDDEQNPRPGAGRSVGLLLDYGSRRVFREIAFQ